MARRILSLVLLALLPAATAFSGARRFTYVYESTTGVPGGFEIENWVTWKTHMPDDRKFREVDFRHEIEFALTDRLTASVYVADWQYERDRSLDDGNFSYTGSALELIYSLTSPVADPIGLAVYQEYKVGNRLFEWESKAIAQKNFGKLIAAYNATLEATWEGRDFSDRFGELQQSLGVSYEINPHLLFGAEFLHEIAFPDWSRAARGVFFAGPNVSLRSGKYWATITALAQLTHAGGEPDLQVRTIFGFTF